MKSILKTSVITFLLLVTAGFICFGANATEETINGDSGEPYHLLRVIQEESRENEVTKREESLVSSIGIEITNPKKFLHKLGFIKGKFDKFQFIGWNLEDEGLKEDTSGSLDVDSRECPEVREDVALRSSPRLLPKKRNVIIVIDVFRAFTTACYILASNPASYMLAKKSTTISQLRTKSKDPLLIGKAERGATLSYDIPNSPMRVEEAKITGRNILHRTEGGSTGVLMSKGWDVILATGLANADATVRYVTQLQNTAITILPMGHEGTTPSLEDDICAHYIHAKLKGHTMDLTPYFAALREGSGKYFFTDDQWQYPSQDFDYCIEVNRFNFAIQAEVQDEYAILRRLDEGSSQ